MRNPFSLSLSLSSLSSSSCRLLKHDGVACFSWVGMSSGYRVHVVVRNRTSRNETIATAPVGGGNEMPTTVLCMLFLVRGTSPHISVHHGFSFGRVKFDRLVPSHTSLITHRSTTGNFRSFKVKDPHLEFEPKRCKKPRARTLLRHPTLGTAAA